METLAIVLVATAADAAHRALRSAILAARNDRLSTALRPILDAAQTMPAFVYLLPGRRAVQREPRFTAIVAAIIFAHPAGHPAGRDRHPRRPGDRRRGGPSRPARPLASCSGRSSCRSPGRRSCSRPNQGIVLVLAMVVVGGLVGRGRAGLRRHRRLRPDARTSARASPRASRSSCSGSCSIGSRRAPGRGARPARSRRPTTIRPHAGVLPAS